MNKFDEYKKMLQAVVDSCLERVSCGDCSFSKTDDYGTPFCTLQEYTPDWWEYDALTHKSFPIIKIIRDTCKNQKQCHTCILNHASNNTELCGNEPQYWDIEEAANILTPAVWGDEDNGVIL